MNQLKKIFAATVIAHILVIFVLSFTKPAPTKRHSLAVQYIQEPQTIAPKQTTAASSKQTTQKVASSAPKKKQEKKPVVNQNKQWLEKIAKKIEQAEQKQKKQSFNKPVELPQSLEIAVPKSTEQNVQANTVYFALQNFFKNQLNLPVQGKVKAMISVNAQGKLTELMILESSNELNDLYLKKTLKDLTFPEEIRNQSKVIVVFIGR